MIFESFYHTNGSSRSQKNDATCQNVPNLTMESGNCYGCFVFLFLNLPPPQKMRKQVLENNLVISAHLSVTEMVHGLVDSLMLQQDTWRDRCDECSGRVQMFGAHHLLVIVFGIVSNTFGKWICY